MRVIVVGAGIAGLVAADAARCAGADVVVAEARDRLGGRIHTVPLGPGKVDLGGAWVHDPIGNPVTEALEAAGVQTSNDGAFGAPMAVWADGWVDAIGATTVAGVLQADWDPVQALAATGSDRFVDGVEWFIADRGLDGELGDLARATLLSIVAPLVSAAPPDRVSLTGAAAYVQEGGGNLVPADGYGALAEALAEGLDVRLGSAVSRIEHGRAGVSVVTDGEVLEGDCAVVTLPLGVLRAGSVVFDPMFPDSHSGAVERLAMGTLEKVVFRFAEQFWPDALWEISYLTEDRSFPAWFDFSRHVGAPSLIALYNPYTAKSLGGLPSGERVAPALAALRTMFGDVPAPEETLASDWTADPFALGSYSYVPVGASPDDMRRLGEPLSDRLILCGEATVPEHHGTVQAAFLSGLRAAEFALGVRPEQLSFTAIPQHWWK